MPTWYLTHNRCSVNRSSHQKNTRGGITGGALLPGTAPGGCLQLKPKATAASYRAACFCGELRRLTSRSEAAFVSRFPADSNLETPSGPPWEDSSQLCVGNGSRQQSLIYSSILVKRSRTPRSLPHPQPPQVLCLSFVEEFSR